MGLGVALSNSLSGMRATQQSVDVVSRNVASAGTPGYHRQSVGVVDYTSTGSSYVRTQGVERAFDKSLQNYYTRQVADASSASVQAGFLDRLQTFLGKPGSPGALDTLFNAFSKSMETLATSPDSFGARADMVLKAQDLAGTLNRLSGSIQTMRQETEQEMTSTVTQLNQMLSSLAHANGRIQDLRTDPVARSALLDQRDRLVSGIAEFVDIQADYRPDGTVALTTRNGVGLLDVRASLFEFEPVGAVTSTSLLNTDDSQSGVGRLLINTPSGLVLDVAKQGVLQGGRLHGLLELRDNSLVEAQSQLDEIAAGLAQAFSTVTTEGTAQTVGAAAGFSVDLSKLQPGNDLLVSYRQGGVDKAVRFVRVDDTSKLPMDYVGGDNVRVVGVNMSAGMAAVVTTVGTALGAGLSVSSPSGSVLRILDDGAAGTTDVTDLESRHTATGTQDGTLALQLFVDATGRSFTSSRDGVAQKIGFASRISVNLAVARDNKLLVQHTAGTPMGDAARANFMIEQLDTMKFATDPGSPPSSGAFKLGGTVGQIMSQALNFQGETVATALRDQESFELSLESLESRMQSETGVNVDEEMARLMELQNAYAANARVVSIVQELLDALMNI